MRSKTEMASATDRSATFDALYRRHSPAAWRLAQSITKNPHDASDAVAEAFAKVFQAMSAGRLGDLEDPGPYVMAATRNASIDVLRRAGRLQPAGGEEIDPPESTAGPSDRLVDGEDRSLVAQAFAELPPRWRAILWLTEVESMPPRDVAPLLRLSPNNVAQLAVRARSRLRERYVQVHVRNHATGACLEVVEQLGRLAAGELAPPRDEAVRAHLAGCADCRARLAELDDLGLQLRRAIIPLGLVSRRPKGARWYESLRMWRRPVTNVAAGVDQLPMTAVQQLAASPVAQQVVGVVAAGLLVVGGVIAATRDSTRPEPAAAAPAPSALAEGVPSSLPTAPAQPDATSVTTEAATTTTSSSSTSTTSTTVAAARAPAAPAAPARVFPRLTGAVLSTVAEANGASLPIFDGPGAPAPGRSLANPQASGAPLVLLVTESRPDWLEVLLPVRPNGSTGWVRRSDVTLRTHNYRITVELGAHRITVYRGADVILSEPVAVGTTDAPTPGGLYYTKELIQPLDAAGHYDPGGPYGPYAYGLSGYSEVLTSFAGGDGQFGIHGTNDPSALGSDVSHGCIRMSNAGITALARELPLGVPVEVLA